MLYQTPRNVVTSNDITFCGCGLTIYDCGRLEGKILDDGRKEILEDNLNEVYEPTNRQRKLASNKKKFWCRCDYRIVGQWNKCKSCSQRNGRRTLKHLQ